ncbi:MAG: LapA family protein [Clostridiales bacterium]|nr:LapA family protein [Clostridiales bacterium]
MQLTVIISMFFALFIAIFAVQNASVITINFLWYEKNMSQALVILGSTLVGIIIMVPFDIIRRIKTGIKINELNNRIRKLNEELEQAKSNKESAYKKNEGQYDSNKK